jgi:Ca2+-binding RTX toxin-like protein
MQQLTPPARPRAGHFPMLRRGLAATAGVAALALVASASAQAATPTCRASAVRVSAPPLTTVEPTVAGSGAGCATDAQRVVDTVAAGPLSVTAPTATTRSGPGVIAAGSGVAGVSLALAGVPISVGAVAAEQTVSCASGENVVAGSSHVDALNVAGTPVPIVAGQPLDLDLGVVRVRANQLVGDVRQALVLNAGDVQVVLGEAQAAGDACATLGGGAGTADGDDGTPGGGTGPGTGSGAGAGADSPRICPQGSSYRVASNACVIGDGDGADGGDTVIGAPYDGPRGGSVLSLETALAMVKAGTLADSVCLHGKGLDYVLLGTTTGKDRLTGTNGDDRILGLPGDDQVDGGRGADCVDGGAGADALSGGTGEDHLVGGTGGDHLNGGPGSDVLDGGAGNDTINTAFGADRVSGGAGRDAINAATSGPAAVIDGGSGRDTVRINTNERKRVKHAEKVHVMR